MKKNIINLALIAVVVLFILVVAGCDTHKESVSDKNIDKVTVTDLEGRTVTLKYPVERIIILESSRTDELSAIYGEGFEDKIVGWDNDLKVNAGDAYQMYIEKYPKMADIPDVGSLDDNTFSIEKVISLKPDVVIMHSWQFMWCEDAANDAISKLEQAGTPVVFVDFFMEPLTNSTKSMLLLGEIMGREQRAKKIVDFYNEITDDVYSRLDKINSDKPDVYFEYASKGPNVYGITSGNVDWGSIVKKAGGNNIAEPLLGNKSEALNPEYLLDKNPEVIILTGRNWSTPGSLRMGYTTSLDHAKGTMDPFIQRPGWNTIDAVKNHRVYGIYHGYGFSIYNFAALQALATWFYPEEFKDVDPNNTLKEYHEKFMPIDYTGTFFFSYY